MDSNKAVKPEKIQKNMRTSVRSIVEFIFREGDIDNRFGRSTSTEAMLEGTRIHKKIQSSQGGNYQAEVPLQLTLKEDQYLLTIDGRADGIFTEEFYGFLPEEHAMGERAGVWKVRNLSAERENPENYLRISGGKIGSRKKRKVKDKSETQAEADTRAEADIRAEADTRAEEDIRAEEDTRAKGENIPSSLVWIDEIKGIYHKLEHMKAPVYVHLAQAKCYAYMYAVLHDEPCMGVQMTYCNMDTEEIRRFRYTYAFSQLEEWFGILWREYRKWADFECEWEKIRQTSIKQLEFPFLYREGQKELAQDVYRTILRKKNLFIQAPTGVGKTITTLFPAIKAMGENLADRIFYLTAKTVTASVARDTFELLEQRGYRAKTVQLTAKDKICLCGEKEGDLSVRGECNPINCPYAKGHFDRINDALYELLADSDMPELLTREAIRRQAEKYQVCPFELSLDLSSFSDNIICDYNYVFDPKVALKRFFGEGMKGNYLFLIDEAHNLADRSREMYSAVLYKEEFLNIKKLLAPEKTQGKESDSHTVSEARTGRKKKAHLQPDYGEVLFGSAEIRTGRKKNTGTSPEIRKIIKELDKCNKVLLEYKRESENYRIYEDIGPFLMPLQRLAADLDELLQKPDDIPNRKEILEFYFNIRNFLYIYDLLTDKYVIYSEIQEDGRFMLKLFCVDPSENLQRYLDKGRSAVFFSATLLPVNYYKSLLSTKEDNYAVYAHSSFSPENRLILIGRDISTKYTRRTETEFRRYAEYIRAITGAKKGNYIVFFPSYKLMEQVYTVFRSNAGTASEMEEKEHCIVQSPYMKEAEREAFLAEFDHPGEYTLIAFCIMGGIFGEGIDLKNERLIGTIIAGTGLPQVCNEREILKKYYDNRQKNGFDYAYRFPGLNKVFQAGGRVIRTEEDTGVIALLDERFLYEDYQSFFPREWENRKITGIHDAGKFAECFWQHAEEK